MRIKMVFNLKAKIGDMVVLTRNIYTSFESNYGIHFLKGEVLKVVEIEATVSLSNMEIKYRYTVQGSMKGYVNDLHFNLVKSCSICAM